MSFFQKNISNRFSLEVICVIAFGLAGSLAVYCGNAYGWSGFNAAERHWGTHFLDNYLYAIGDPMATRIVATIWFVYGSLIGIALVLFTRRVFPQQRS